MTFFHVVKGLTLPALNVTSHICSYSLENLLSLADTGIEQQTPHGGTDWVKTKWLHIHL